MDILVVDDAPGVADIVVQMLDMHGHHARMASTVDEAMRAISDTGYGACIVDLGIVDEKDELLTMLKARRVRAIGWTASEDLWRGSARAERFDSFLSKPSSFEMILAAVEGRSCPACGKPIEASIVHQYCMWNRS